MICALGLEGSVAEKGTSDSCWCRHDMIVLRLRCVRGQGRDWLQLLADASRCTSASSTRLRVSERGLDSRPELRSVGSASRSPSFARTELQQSRKNLPIVQALQSRLQRSGLSCMLEDAGSVRSLKTSLECFDLRRRITENREHHAVPAIHSMLSLV